MFEKQTSSNIEDIHLMHLYLSAPCSVSVLVLVQAATQEEHELKGHLFFPVLKAFAQLFSAEMSMHLV